MRRVRQRVGALGHEEMFNINRNINRYDFPFAHQSDSLNALPPGRDATA